MWGVRGLAVAIRDSDARKWPVVIVTLRSLYPQRKDVIFIVQEVGRVRGRFGWIWNILHPLEFEPRTIYVVACRCLCQL